jgi:hypothetical protein
VPSGPLVEHEYDWLEWVIRAVFFAFGLAIGFVLWHVF